MDHALHDVGRVELQRGGTLPAARIAYKTHGRLDGRRSNAVLFPTWFGSRHPANEWLIGPGRALDPERWFIVVVNILGNGLSSSPSNTPPPFDRARFPEVTLLDNVRLQRRLLAERFGVERLALVVGRSMGAQLAFQWAASYPAAVERMLALAGSARTSPHNYVFLESLRSAITSSAGWRNGDYAEPPLEGLATVQLVFDAWGYSQAYYRAGLHLAQGHPSTEAYVGRGLQDPSRDANDLLCQIRTWQNADISDNETYRKDLPAALRSIEADAIVMPCRTDLYFPPEDSEAEVSCMRSAELRVIPSIWGHRAGAPGTDPADIEFVDRAIRDLLAG